MQRPATTRVYYDGSCGLCHASVRFALARDRRARLRFAPLGGPSFLAETSAAERAALPDSIALRSAQGGALLVRARAVAALLIELGGAWAVLGRALALVPRPLGDLGYRALASARRRLWRAPAGACPLVPPAALARFDP